MILNDEMDCSCSCDLEQHHRVIGVKERQICNAMLSSQVLLPYKHIFKPTQTYTAMKINII